MSDDKQQPNGEGKSQPSESPLADNTMAAWRKSESEGAKTQQGERSIRAGRYRRVSEFGPQQVGGTLASREGQSSGPWREAPARTLG
jgi:hypothetical protein